MDDAHFFAGLVPELVVLADRHRKNCHAHGLDLVFMWGARTWAQQLEMYEKGRARSPCGWVVTDEKLIVTRALPDKSAHCRGCAYDCAPLDQHEKIDWTRKDLFEAVAEFAPTGLRWGGAWGDNDHFELPNWEQYPLLTSAST